jgi:hypothetical protein
MGREGGGGGEVGEEGGEGEGVGEGVRGGDREEHEVAEVGLGEEEEVGEGVAVAGELGGEGHGGADVAVLADALEGVEGFLDGLKLAVGGEAGGAAEGAVGEGGGEGGAVWWVALAFEPAAHFGDVKVAKAQGHAAAEDGREQALGLIGEEDEEVAGGGLFEGLEEGVGGFDAEEVGVVDEDDAPAGLKGAVGEALGQVADLLNLDLLAVGGEGEEVGVLVGFDAAAVAALAAGGEGVGALAKVAALAAEGLGHPQGDLALASAGSASEEPRVVEALAAEGLRDAGAGASVAIDIVEGVGGGGHQGLRERVWAGP